MRLRNLLRHPVARVALAYVVLVEVVVQIAFGNVALGPLQVGFQEQTIPRAIFLNGAITGLLYGLLGMGLILVYKANRIINFAQAQLGAVPAIVALLLYTRKDVPYLLVVPLMLIAAVALGAMVERLIIRRFRDAPRLILTVATIGVSLLLVGLEIAVQQVITGEMSPGSTFSTPFSSIRTEFGPLNFTGDFAVAAMVTLVLVGLLVAFFRYTDMGIATRAAAENGDRAALLGIPVLRVSTVVWIIAAVLSAVAVFLRAPVVGLSLGGAVGPTLLLYGLTAAVIARMDSLPTCVVAGMGIGVVDQAAVFGTRHANLATVAMLVVILIALLAQRADLSRALDSGVGTWQAAREYRSIPSELRNLTEVRVARVVLGVGLSALAVLPLLLPERFAGRFTLVVIVAMVGVSLVILTGWSGQISLGQFAFTGIGSAVTACLAIRGFDFFVCLAAAGLVGAVAATVVGLPALRIQGLFLAVTTLAFAFVVSEVVLNPRYFGWLLPKPGESVGRPILYGRITTESDYRYYTVCLVFLGATLAVARSLRRRRSGRVFIGLRDNRRAVEAYGVNSARTRLAAFAISGFIAALAGGLLAYASRAVDAPTFAPGKSISVFAVTVIGGLTSLPGALMGALYVEGVPAVLGSSDTVVLLTSGIGLLFLLLVQPGGLSEIYFRLRDRYLRAVADRHSLHVPSLIADSLVLDDDADPTTTVAAASTPTIVPVLSCRGVEVAYGQVQVLFGVDLDVGRGEIVALLGTNGAGKSTLLKAISGLVEPMAGSITMGGATITGEDPNTIARHGIVQVPGGKAVFPTLTVREHLRAAGWLYRDDEKRLREASEEVLDTFPRLRERIDQLAGNLSGGEQQMLALGMAFIARPKVLMIDELSLGLAPAIVEQLLGIVRRIQQAGTAIIVVEQSLNVALTLAERAYFLEKGTVRFHGPTTELLERDDIVRSVFLQAGDGTRIAAAPVAPRSRSTRDSEVVLDVRGLVKRFGGVVAVDGTSLRVRSGETLGLIGQNGAGKTTIFDLVSGFLAGDEGTIDLDGTDVTRLGPDARAMLGLGRSFQDARLVPSLTVAENLALGLERHLVVRDHLASALALPMVSELELSVAWTVSDLVELMNLGDYRDKFVRELSTGSRRMVDLAICVAVDPKILLLDEPSSGIAQRETEALGPHLMRIQQETGCALLVIEHDMPLITSISDRMIALELGRPIAEGNPSDVTSDPRVVASYLGGDAAVINRSGANGQADRPPVTRTNGTAVPARRRRSRPLVAGSRTGGGHR